MMHSIIGKYQQEFPYAINFNSFNITYFRNNGFNLRKTLHCRSINFYTDQFAEPAGIFWSWGISVFGLRQTEREDSSGRTSLSEIRQLKYKRHRNKLLLKAFIGYCSLFVRSIRFWEIERRRFLNGKLAFSNHIAQSQLHPLYLCIKYGPLRFHLFLFPFSVVKLIKYPIEVQYLI